jgi:hypothetical protein
MTIGKLKSIPGNTFARQSPPEENWRRAWSAVKACYLLISGLAAVASTR